jgi:hypothetical protein
LCPSFFFFLRRSFSSLLCINSIQHTAVNRMAPRGSPRVATLLPPPLMSVSVWGTYLLVSVFPLALLVLVLLVLTHTPHVSPSIKPLCASLCYLME